MAEEPPIEEGFSTFEMRASRRGTMKSQRGTMKSTTSRKSSNLAMINSSRNPPRPTPGLVNYSDEDSGKGYDENPDDSDSLTEKPSEISSTDSQVGFHSFFFFFENIFIFHFHSASSSLLYLNSSTCTKIKTTNFKYGSSSFLIPLQASFPPSPLPYHGSSTFF